MAQFDADGLNPQQVEKELNGLNEKSQDDPKLEYAQAILDMLEDAHKNPKGFDIRGPLGQRFARATRPGTEQGAAYRECKTHQAKLAFRKEWAEQRLQEAQESKTEKKSWRQMDANNGTYVCFAKLVENQGYQYDPTGAVLRASRYAYKCVMMQGKFVSMNKMTETMEFLEVTRTHSEMFENCWTLYRTEYDAKVNVRDAELDDDGGDNNKNASASAASKPKVSAALTSAPKSSPKAKVAAPINKMQNAMAKANKLKKAYHEATSMAVSLVGRIESGDSSWSWAHNPGNVGVLRHALDRLANSLVDFDKEFLICDNKEMKLKFGQEHLLVHLEAFAKKEDAILEVSRKYKQVMARHAAGSSIQ